MYYMNNERKDGYYIQIQVIKDEKPLDFIIGVPLNGGLSKIKSITKKMNSLKRYKMVSENDFRARLAGDEQLGGKWPCNEDGTYCVIVDFLVYCYKDTIRYKLNNII